MEYMWYMIYPLITHWRYRIIVLCSRYIIGPSSSHDSYIDYTISITRLRCYKKSKSYWSVPTWDKREMMKFTKSRSHEIDLSNCPNPRGFYWRHGGPKYSNTACKMPKGNNNLNYQSRDPVTSWDLTLTHTSHMMQIRPQKGELARLFVYVTFRNSGDSRPWSIIHHTGCLVMLFIPVTPERGRTIRGLCCIQCWSFL